MRDITLYAALFPSPHLKRQLKEWTEELHMVDDEIEDAERLIAKAEK